MKSLSLFRAVLILALASLILGQSALADSVYEDYTFTTFAGPSEWVSASRDGVGLNARFTGPADVVMDSNGNFYIADRSNNTIRKMAPNGQITTLAGLAGASGTNDGLAAAARFFGPNSLAVDPQGNVYVADTGNHTIRKITPAGFVTTIAGMPGVLGKVNGTGSVARFDEPFGLTISGTNIYVADTLNDAIRVVTPNGVVSTFAGTLGVAGSADKTGTAATFKDPTAIATDSSGNFYVTDAGNNTIRKISPAAAVTTLAGSATNAPGTNNGAGAIAQFNTPFGLTVDTAGNVYVADTLNDTIRLVTPAGVVSTFAGVATNTGVADGTGSAARFDQPFGIAVDSNTNLYVCDFLNNTIRKIDPSAAVTTIAGLAGGVGAIDGPPGQARFNSPAGAAVDTSGNIFIADENNQTIRKITPDGTVSTFAGTTGVKGTNDALGTAATFNHPVALAFDSNDNLYVADAQNHAIRMITPAGLVSTFAGTIGQSGFTNGVGTQAQFFQPLGIAVDSSNNVYVADTQNQAIRKITPAGVVSTVQGTNSDTGLAASFSFPEGIVADPDGNVFVVDNGDFTIREITPAGVVSTVAGLSGVSGSSDGTGTNATFNFPFGLTMDTNRNLYVVDSFNNIIRKVTPAGVVTTLGGAPGVTGDVDATGDQARLRSPEGIAVDSGGNLYVADANNASIRKASPALPDRPTVDLIGARTGMTRHFGVTNSTATSFSWSLIRQPAGSSAEFAGANTANPTFTPDVEDIYEIQFQASDNSGHSTIRRITIYADDTPPTITITNPAAGNIASNGVLNVSGTTTDNLGVSNVFVQINGGPWTNATGTTNWAVLENLVPGPQGVSTNIIRAYSQDFAGNVSATNEFDLPYILSDRLKVAVRGGGTLKPNLNGIFLHIGQTYSIAVKAASGSTFSNWTANLIPGTNSETFTFVMQSNLSLTANCIDHEKPTVAIVSPKPARFFSVSSLFVAGTAKDNDSVSNVFYQLNGGAWTNATGTTNWFASLKLNAGTNVVLVYAQDPSGNRSTTNRALLNYLPTAIAGGSYAGLFFDTNNVTATNAGFFSAAVAPTASFSAKILLGSSTVSFSGQFSQDGVFSNSVVAKGFNTPFIIQLTLDLTGAGTITGTIANSGWSSPLLANQDVFNALNPPSQQFQRFSLVIPGGADSTNQPGGNSAGTIILDGAGNVSFIGSLADNSPAAQKTFISKGGLWPFYISSSSGQGVMLGWLTFSPGQRGTLKGQVYWARLPQANASLYPGGFNFTNGIIISGSFYDFFDGVPVLVLTNSQGQAVFQQAGFSPALTNHFTMNSFGLRDIITGSNKLNLTISLFTGAFKGTVVNPANNLSIPVSGVILTNQNAGFGFFVNSNQSGSVFIGTNSP